MSEPSNPLLESVTSLKGIGTQMAERLAKLGITTVQDLLFHLPSRYQDRTRIYPIAYATIGTEVLIEGTVVFTDIIFRKRRMMLCHIEDDTARILLRFFYFSSAQQTKLSSGTKIRCFGEIRQGYQQREMIHPEYKILDEQAVEMENTLTPSYPATEGVQQRTLRRLTQEALLFTPDLEDLIPENIRQHYQLPSLQSALQTIHNPPPETVVADLLSGQHPAQKRLIFEEMMAHHLSLSQLKLQTKQLPSLAINKSDTLYQKLLAQLPFTLTGAQTRVIQELFEDMQQPSPMHRLVQGDVGSGKTLVAAAAALFAIESDLQVGLIAPTEILAEQHYQNFRDWLEPLNLEVTWVPGKKHAKQHRSSLEDLALGITDIAIGTHALFQKDVQFNQLGLIIVDEQHRFGVDQRLALREKGKQGEHYPHQLIMTATPIPRTLAMTTCADLDYSVIDELPPGRQVIKTVAIANTRRDEIITRIQAICDQGRQVYWVCTLIEESEALQCQAAEQACELLQENLPTVSIDLVHGRMNGNQKDAVMQMFKKGKTQLLVATTVIEVGVDVPNASLMIIENAERLGLSQLHQLRGRVGRGKDASSCVLLYQPPLSETAYRRINALRETGDGFEIARIDLDIRGPGEVFGTRQTGELRFRIADLMRDQHLLPQVQQASLALQQQDPNAVEKLIQRWIHRADDYVNV
ncbi:MAG TPA: ATP-dependent DNA helicase RecG [Thiothrix sp.]|nr:ATP-dependent DNA helicase RecG [Thiothrix sp.]